jgi:hypothetical protein
MLKVLSARLQAISESPEDEFYEVHLPSEFYSDNTMFEDGAKKNVEIVLSESIAGLFKAVPNLVDVDGSVLQPQYGQQLCITRTHWLRSAGTKCPRNRGKKEGDAPLLGSASRV